MAAVPGPGSFLTPQRILPRLAGTDRLIGVVQLAFGPDEAELDRDAEPLTGLDQVLAAAGVAGARLVGLRRRPRRHQRPLRPRQRSDLSDPGGFAARPAGQDRDLAA